MPDISFFWRVVALLVVAAFFLLLDRLRPAAQRKRSGEYTFLFLMGLAGALFGAVNDCITSAIAPEYFIFGKGLDEGPNLTTDAMELGSQAGFAGGIIGAALVLYFANARTAVSKLYRWVPVPFAAAVLTGAGMGLASWLTGWFQVFGNLFGALTPEQTDRFYTVWHMHIGIYLGAFVGLVGVIRHVRKGPSEG